MNSHSITNLPILTLPHEAANKLYVDSNSRKILQGYVPPLRGSRKNIKLGFIATASSQLNNNYKASNAFNYYYTGRRGTGVEWVSNNETRNFCIRVKCPDLVRIWKVALRGTETNTQRIYRWQLEASTDGENFLTLFSAPNPTYLGNEVQQFEVDTVRKYNCYTLCLEAEPSNPGLSYMQIFIYSE